MTVSLESMTARVRALLGDEAGLIWPAERVEGLLRLALGELNHAAGEGFTLLGLDGAQATSLPAGAESLLAAGATAWGLAQRVNARSEGVDASRLAVLLPWVRELRAQFTAGLERLRQDHLAQAETPPYSGWEFPLEEGTE